MDQFYTTGLLEAGVWPPGALLRAHEGIGADSHGPVMVEKSQWGPEDSLWWAGRMVVKLEAKSRGGELQAVMWARLDGSSRGVESRHLA